MFSSESIPEKQLKKFIDKLHWLCSFILKFNINSPCLLQIIRIDGVYELILTHNHENGERINIQQLLSITSKNNIIIPEEDVGFFIFDAEERISLPIIISTIDISQKNLQYDYSLDSYYIYPGYILKLIKNKAIKDCLFKNSSFDIKNNKFYFEFIVENKTEFDFILNNDQINSLLNLYILPLEHNGTKLRNLYEKVKDKEKCVDYVNISEEEWKKLIERNKYRNFIKIDTNSGIDIYHNDFFQKTNKEIDIFKYYDNPTSNIVNLYIKTKMNHDVYEYFRYRYYEL